MECLTQLRELCRALWPWWRPGPPHIHTATPPQKSPWCAECDALLTQAIAEDEKPRQEEAMTNLERWLKRFGDGAGAAYTWHAPWQDTPSGHRRLLRAWGEDETLLPGEPCPVTMQEHHDGFQSMLGPEILQIIAAADDDPDADRHLRATLLGMCRVKEIDA
jgi:hypothetical protein